MDLVSAYTYDGQSLCSDCMDASVPHSVEGATLEDRLDNWAQRFGITRWNECSYDSRDFPKIVFSFQIEDSERCDNCEAEIH